MGLWAFGQNVRRSEDQELLKFSGPLDLVISCFAGEAHGIEELSDRRSGDQKIRSS
jgi:hypothetical protein